MSYNDILLHVDASRAGAARLDFAIQLATRLDAHLTGLYVHPRLLLPAAFAADLPPQYFEMQTEALEQQGQAVKSAFEAACADPGLRWEWREARGVAVDELASQARYADLLVLGQSNPDEPDHELPGVPDEVLLAAGRPLLLLPHGGASRQPGKRVLVAWNASRESARALHDALPLMRGAEQVTVMVADVDGGEAEEAAAPGADICLHLARHGIVAQAQHVRGSDIDVSDILLSRAADLDVDLIVMGAYGHSRLRELMLGGVTRQMLRQMTVPVLMSH